jgi:hypothetical protein
VGTYGPVLRRARARRARLSEHVAAQEVGAGTEKTVPAPTSPLSPACFFRRAIARISGV